MINYIIYLLIVSGSSYVFKLLTGLILGVVPAIILSILTKNPDEFFEKHPKKFITIGIFNHAIIGSLYSTILFGYTFGYYTQNDGNFWLYCITSVVISLWMLTESFSGVILITSTINVILLWCGFSILSTIALFLITLIASIAYYFGRINMAMEHIQQYKPHQPLHSEETAISVSTECNKEKFGIDHETVYEIVNRYGQAVDSLGENEIVRYSDKLPFDIETIKIAIKFFIADLFWEQRFDEEAGNALVTSYSLLNSFVERNEADKINGLYKKHKEGQHLSKEEYNLIINIGSEQYDGELHDEINDFIGNLYEIEYSDAEDFTNQVFALAESKDA